MDFSLGRISLAIDSQAESLLKICSRAFAHGSASLEAARIAVVVDDAPPRDRVQIDRFAAVGDGHVAILDSGTARIWFDPTSLGSKVTTIRVTRNADPVKVFVNVLEPIIRAKLALHADTSLLHASGVATGDGAWLFPAWGGTGKTNLLLHFLLRGMDFYGDDLVPVMKNGTVLPYAKPLNIFDYNLRVYPELGSAAGVGFRVGRTIKSALEGLLRLLTAARPSHATSVKALSKVLEYSKAVVNLKVDMCDLESGATTAEPAPVRGVFLLTRSTCDTVTIVPVDPVPSAARMAACQAFEWRRFNDYLNAYHFATGEGVSPSSAELSEIDSAILSRAFSDSKLFEIGVPRGGMTRSAAEEISDLVVGIMACS